ncbi:hypothetical protein H6A22_10865, partial [Collinsella intestinalis]|nr:hypothetical protein [Collinsella intestinalis]
MSVDKLLRSVCMNALLVLLLTLFCFPVGVFGLGNEENLSGNEFRTVEYDSSAAYGMDISVDGKPLSSSAIHVGQSVQMHVTGLTEQSNYVFNYVWSYNGNWEFWSSTLLETGDYTPLSMSEFTPLRAGTYILYVDIVTPDGTYSVSDSIAVYEDWSVAGVNIDAPSAHIGEAVSVTSNLTGPDAAYARFNYVWRYEGGWDDWSSTLKETGDYTSDSS